MKDTVAEAEAIRKKYREDQEKKQLEEYKAKLMKDEPEAKPEPVEDKTPPPVSEKLGEKLGEKKEEKPKKKKRAKRSST